MIDACIEFVLHPMRLFAAVEQAIGVPFQIGEIQDALLAFDALIMFEQALTGAVPGEVQRKCREACELIVGVLYFVAECLVEFQKTRSTCTAKGSFQRLAGLACARFASGGEQGAANAFQTFLDRRGCLQACQQTGLVFQIGFVDVFTQQCGEFTEASSTCGVEELRGRIAVRRDAKQGVATRLGMGQGIRMICGIGPPVDALL